ncbi:MAG: phospho-N-acetylmuramoyl-pentapeptide-transferase [Candidatus Latescibacteria bacterium]|jgi:phospho-N-acetylmuramoyl-pentapeptide-transferase|nr:phospho-N-acetylmuramoyl-pentapeptide-transferase [Candidatus Latescibacterota bacterium]
MLYHIFVPFTRHISAFNIFNYITFRAGYALMTALLVAFIMGPVILRFLARRHIEETIRSDGPESHLSKKGTPTMGGLIVLAAIVVPTLLWARLDNIYIQLALFSTVWMGVVGFLDDYLKVRLHFPKGLVAKYKLVGQILLGCIVGSFLFFNDINDQYTYMTLVPFLKNYAINYSHWYIYIPMVTLVITATSNAVNLTDGLDGLAIGLTAISMSTYAIICYIMGRATTSEYLGIFYIPGCGELTIFCLSIVGASLGFLWFNFHPAKVFMGDTGALALGGALGTVAILSKTEILLIVIGGVFVVEVMSVIIQVVSYKLRGKRVFKMAPIHHHYELLGWAEEKVVVRFWIVGILLSIVALTTFKLR